MKNKTEGEDDKEAPTMRPSGYIVVFLAFRQEKTKEGKKWVGVCQELGTSTFADTLDEAVEQLKEAVALHLNTLEKVGERERFFREHGIEFHKGAPKSKQATVKNPIELDTFIQPHLQLVPA